MWRLQLNAGHSSRGGHGKLQLVPDPKRGNKAKGSPDHIGEHISALRLCMHLLLHCLLCQGCSLRVKPLSLFVLHAAEHTNSASPLSCALLQDAHLMATS